MINFWSKRLNPWRTKRLISLGTWLATRLTTFGQEVPQQLSQNTLVSTLLLGLGIGCVGILANSLSLWQPLEWQGYRLLFQTQSWGVVSRSGWDDRLVLIAIDEKSLQHYGQFNSWSRDLYIELLDILEFNPPAAIGFDLILSDPAPEDEILAEAMAFNGGVVLAFYSNSQGIVLDPRQFLQVADRGHVFKLLDADGISRKTWLYVPDETTGQPMPSLAVALAQVYNRNLDESPISLPNPVPQLEDNAAWINWPDKPQTLTTYSFADVLADQIDPAVFANKIVLFGITAAAFDPLQTPFPDQPTAAGVYLHGAVLNNLLQRNFLQRSPQGLNRLLLLSLAMGSAWVLNRQGFRNRILLLLAFPLAWFGVAVVAFSVNYWLPIAAPMATVWLTGVGLQMREQREKRLLMTLFAKHVAPETAQLIWRRRTEIFQEGELQAQELPATVLFMDIRGFTTISERFQPAELLHWLNRYLDVMTNCIMDHGGVVDKYIGDAIMAVFGIPVPRPDEAGIRQDALNAIAASLEMYDRLQTLNQAFSQEGKPTIRFGIGIHTGTVVAGSVGGSRHIEYSVIGDTVNTAARIEALNKKPDPDNPYDLLVSGQTYAYIRQYYGAKAMQALRLRGKATATVIYAIQGPQQGDGLVMEDEKSILRRLLT